MNTNYENKNSIKIQTSDKFLTLEWVDGSLSSYHYIWLRDNCKISLDPNSGQRVNSPINIPADIHPEHVVINNKEQLEIRWSDDHHVSQFDLNWLRKHNYSNKNNIKQANTILWDSSFDMSICKANYEAVLEDKTVQKEWLSCFKNYGFAMLEGVPERPKIVLDIAKKLSHVLVVTWGDFFEIDGNIGSDSYLGYSNKALDPHVDDPSFDPVPPVSMLHCISNETSGGVSTMTDSFKVATTLREESPEIFQLLTTSLVKFRLNYNDLIFENETSIIRINDSGALKQVIFNNTAIQPFDFPFEKMEAYYEAYQRFYKMVVSDKFQVRYSLKPGDLTLYDNHRILHGRTAFTGSGSRRLQGCYIARDGLYSRLKMLYKQ